MKCRHCGAALNHVFLDLGDAPPSNAYLSAEDLQKPEESFPLKLYVCDSCWLVQTQDFIRPDKIFKADYAYFSSVSEGWLAHAKRYCAMIAKRLDLDKNSFVIEVASNDGYLLKNFVASGIPCLGIEPTAGTAQAARALGVPVLEDFFGADRAEDLAREGRLADLIVGNNVYAHVPDINDFTKGLKTVLKPGGIITLEFPHLMRLIEGCQFDTVYHEHFSYLSLYTVQKIFTRCALRVFDVEEIPTHGGSLRIYGCHDDDERPTENTVPTLLQAERHAGLRDLAIYNGFQGRADKIKDSFIRFLIVEKEAGRQVAAYGAAAKGNTLLNYARIGPDLLPYICDAAPSKQGMFTPGGHIPILPPPVLTERRPDTIVILPWNIAPEVRRQLACTGEWSARFFVVVPEIAEVS